MSTPSFNPDAYKEMQRKSWGAASAGWLKWAVPQEKATRPVTQRLFGMARISPGQNVLDIASGVGDPAISAAIHVGPSGSVLATDQSSEMLEAAMQRASAAGVSNLSTQVIDAESLSLPTQSFDAALCSWGLMFLPNLPAALGGIHEALMSGGRFAAAVWSSPDKVPLLSLPTKAIASVIEVPPPPAAAPGPFSLADAEALAATFERAGFENVSTDRVNVVFQFSSAESFVEFVLDLAPPVAGVLADKTPEVQSQARGAIVEEMNSYANADGEIVMPNEAICVVGQK